MTLAAVSLLLSSEILISISTCHRLDPALVAAIAQTESAGSRFAARYEPNFQWLYRVAEFAQLNDISLDTETAFQKTSWGLMQVMGANARQFGYEGPLPSLDDENLGLEYGCRYLRSLLERYADRLDVIAAYNAGSPKKLQDGSYCNQKYVDKVVSYLQ